MRLIKLSQFKKQINHIANYFVLDYGEGQEADISPYNFFVDSETFRNQLNKQNIEQKLPSFNGKIIHVCYDMSSNKLYFPEFNSVKELSEIRKNGILEQIKMGISFFNSSVSAMNIGRELLAILIKHLEYARLVISFLPLPILRKTFMATTNMEKKYQTRFRLTQNSWW